MFALARTLVGLLLASFISRLVIVLGRFHQVTPQRLVSRRAFLRNSVLGSVGVATLISVGGFVAFFWNNKTGAFGGEIPVPLDLVPPVGEAPYRNQGGKFYIINNEDGALAIYWKCVHLGCTVPWNEDNDQFICPCHGSVYNRVGERVAGPAPRPLDLFPMVVDGNNVIVNTDPEGAIVRSSYDPSQALKLT
ncbi:MAG TPA: Rieske 2Fe-2S domain-containing protein [Thermomicrobiales bacterium]|nr:Rieske 2Fe-2S domain-containing protein [Thermomicrobiales bacterium]